MLIIIYFVNKYPKEQQSTRVISLLVTIVEPGCDNFKRECKSVSVMCMNEISLAYGRYFNTASICVLLWTARSKRSVWL